MSEPGPDSIPTSHDRRTKRPTKKRALTPLSSHAAHLDSLFARPDKPIALTAALSTASPGSGALPPPPEIVPNVQGSSAGAGSGEFHVYKASRRREYERIRRMQEDVAREEGEARWEAERRDWRRKDEARTSKNKAKREKAKARKRTAVAAATAAGDGMGGAGTVGGAGAGKGKLMPRINRSEVGRRDGSDNNNVYVNVNDEEELDEPEVDDSVKGVETGVIIHDDDL